jgi:hypothetical protein
VYADDLVLTATSPSELQAMMDIVTRWARTHNIRTNASKSNVVIFASTQRSNNAAPRPPDNAWTLSGDNVQEAQVYVYLGARLQFDLRWGERGPGTGGYRRVGGQK